MTDTGTRPRAVLHRGLDGIIGAGPCVVAVGVFDGVHRGHARLIEEAVRAGRSRGLGVRMLTFDPHPARVLGIGRDTSVLTTLERRSELAGALGVDEVVALPFNRIFARCSPAEFVREVLVGALRAEVVTVGSNFTFGHRGQGDVAELERLGALYAMSVVSVALLEHADEDCSATAIRAALRRGDVRTAAGALGRPHRVEGHLLPSGFAVTDPLAAIPAPGMYIVQADDGTIGIAVVDETGCLTVEGVAHGPIGLDFLDTAGDRGASGSGLQHTI